MVYKTSFFKLLLHFYWEWDILTLYSFYNSVYSPNSLFSSKWPAGGCCLNMTCSPLFYSRYLGVGGNRTFRRYRKEGFLILIFILWLVEQTRSQKVTNNNNNDNRKWSPSKGFFPNVASSRRMMHNQVEETRGEAKDLWVKRLEMEVKMHERRG